MMNVKRNASTIIKRALLIFAIIIFAVTCMVACGANADTSDKTEGMAESSFRKQMAKDNVTEIAVDEDLVLEEPLEVNGTKVIYGEGSITAIGDVWTGDDYMIIVSSGAQLTVKGSVSINAGGITGGIRAAEDAVWSIEETASVENASAMAANTLVEGQFLMNGGTLSGAMGHNVHNKGEVTVSGGEIVGSGTKYAGIYSEGVLTQNGGTIRDAYNNVVVLSGSFDFNGGNNQNSIRDGICVSEGTKLAVTAKEAAITGSGVRGIYLCGEATIDGITLSGSGDTLMKISQTGALNLKGGTLVDAGYHSIENAGKVVMTGGSIRNSYNCGIVNTGTLEVTGGSFLDNVNNKAVLNKHDGKTTISGQNVMFSGNRFAVGNEDQAVLDLSKAEILLTTGTNVYAYGGTVNIHDINLGASNSNNVRIYRAEVTMTNVQVLGNSKSGSSTTHGILLEGGVLKAKDVTIKNTTGYGIRNKGGQVNAENLLISKSIKAGGISNMLQDHTGVPGMMVVNNLTVEEIRYNNVVVEGGALTITDGHLAASGTNNVKVTDGVLEMTNVDVLGNQPDVDGTNHTVYMTGGKIVAENVNISDAKVSNLRINGETAVFTGNKVSIKNAPKYGIDQTIGEISINNLTMSGNYYNVSNANGVIKLSNSTLGPTKSNNVRSKGGLVDLRNVVINAHTADHVKSVHALFIDGGTLTGQNITAKNVSNAALRITGGSTTVRGLTVNDAGADGVWISGGKATVYDLTVKKAGVSGVAATKTGNITVSGGSIKNTVSHGAKSENDAKLTLKDISVAIATTAGRHAVLAQGGDVHLEDVKITGNEKNTTGFGIRINRETSHVSGKGIHIKDVNTGISATAGTSDISGVTTENIPAHSVYASATAKLVISDSEFGVTGTNNVKAENKGKITLNDAVIQGTDKNHGLIVENSGNISGKNITVRNTAGAAVRVKCTADGSYVEIDGLVTENIGTHNIYINKDQDAGNVGGVVVKNGDLCRTGTHSVMAEAGNLTLIDTKIQGHKSGTANNIHAIYVSSKADKINLDSVSVLDAAGDALRISAGDVQATDFTSKQTGRNGIWADGGKLTAKNTTVSGSGIGVYATGKAAVVLNGVNISDSSSNSISVNGVELTVNGYADGTKSQIGTSVKDNVVITGGGVVRLNDVDVQEAKANNIVATGGKVYVTDSTVTGGNYSILAQSAGYAELKNVTIKDSVMDGIRVNKADGEIVVNNVQIVDPVRYGVSAEKGTVTLTGDLIISSDANQSRAIYAYNGGEVTTADDTAVVIAGTEYGICVESDAKVALRNITISKCDKNGVKMSAGTAVLNGINISGCGSNNVWVSGGELTINGYAGGNKSLIGNCEQDNVRSNGTAVVRLNDTNILASAKNNVVAIDGGTIHMKDSSVTGGNHSILADKNGKVYLSNVAINGSVTSGIRANTPGSFVEATDVVIDGANTGLSIKCGTVQIEGIKIRNTKAVGVDVRQGDADANVTLKDLVTENCGTHAIYTSGAAAMVTVNGASLSNDGSDSIVYLNGGPMTLNDVAIHKILDGQYALYSGAGWLTIGGEMDAEIYIATDPGRVIKVNKELTGNKLVVDWKKAPTGNALEFSSAAMMTASEDNIQLGAGQILLQNYLSYYSANGKGYATIESSIVPAEKVITSEAELNDYLNEAADYGLADVTVLIGGNFTVSKQVTIPAIITGLTVKDDGNTQTGNTVTYSGSTDGLFVMRSDLKLTVQDISLSSTQKALLKQASGTTELKDVTLSGKTTNIHVTGGKLTVNGGQIGASTADNVKAEGDGVIELNNVEISKSNANNVVAINGGTIRMTDSSVTGGNHSVLADKDGKVYLNNVEIRNSATSGIRANHSGSIVEATDVVIDGAKNGLSFSNGNVQITDITIRNTTEIGVRVEAGSNTANVTLNNLVTENCGTHAIYTSGAAAKLTVNGGTLGSDGSHHVVNLNGGPMVLNDVTINGANLAAGQYELYSGAGWLTIGGAMDANVYIATNPGRVIKVNKELTGNNLVIDWKNAPTGNALEFTGADMMNASMDNIKLGSTQVAAGNALQPYNKDGKYYAKLINSKVSTETQLNDHLKNMAQQGVTDVTVLVGGNFDVANQVAVPAGITSLTIRDDGNTATGNTVKYTGSTEGLFNVGNGLKLTVKDISLSSTKTVLLKQSGGELIVDNCILDAANKNILQNSGKLTVRNSTLKLTTSNNVTINENLTLEGNVVVEAPTSAENVHGLYFNNGNITINGNVTVTGAKGSSIQCGNDTRLTINESATVNINGGGRAGLLVGHRATVSVKGALSIANTTGPAVYVGYWSNGACSLTIADGGKVTVGKDANGNGIANVGIKVQYTGTLDVQSGGSLRVSDTTGDGINISASGVMKLAGDVNATVVSVNRPVEVTGEITGALTINWTTAPSGSAITFASEEVMNAFKDSVTGGKIQIANYTLQYSAAEPWQAILVEAP